ncbi:hypothetical protein [uncultured Sphaerochaeta sp.]|uniref:hypothetical protein n=1 Tax=uncultured Sphaerochaeta sp. TaxID=886478 RepID=UPI002A0A36E6|nr:hypothetical protein [uncultured Sphaerochaeta sp.]
MVYLFLVMIGFQGMPLDCCDLQISTGLPDSPKTGIFLYPWYFLRQSYVDHTCLGYVRILRRIEE